METPYIHGERKNAQDKCKPMTLQKQTPGICKVFTYHYTKMKILKAVIIRFSSLQ
jgi:hypothetical protein